MVVELTSGVTATLLEEAARAHPRECCGLLLGQGARVEQVVPALNVHAEPLHQFEIDPQTLISAHRAARSGGPQVVGYYHSHPNDSAEPSLTDLAGASGDGLIWAIIAGEAVSWWRDQPGGFEVLPTRVAAS